jgi:hypothetical protein
VYDLLSKEAQRKNATLQTGGVGDVLVIRSKELTENAQKAAVHRTEKKWIRFIGIAISQVGITRVGNRSNRSKPESKERRFMFSYARNVRPDPFAVRV